jgi:DNA repair protein RecN (Recombination protein N)
VLRAIELRDFAIADEVEVPLGPGLNVLTGETGAGKSLLVDALALATGARAESGVVRAGAASALVQLHFGDGAPVATASRRVVPGGRNLARLDGEVVTVAELQGALDGLVGIFGQHAYRTLLEGEQQRLALDRHLAPAGVAALAAYRDAHAEVLACEGELAALHAATTDRAARLELARHALDELDAAAIRPGEVAALEARLAVLRAADRIAHGAGRALDALQDRDGAAADVLAEAMRSLDAAARLAPPLEPLAHDLRAALDGVHAIAAEIEAFLDGLEADPGALDRAEARRAVLGRVLLKHGGDEARALERRDELAAQVARLERHEADAAQLEASRRAAAARRGEAGEALSQARATVAKRLASDVTRALHDLALPHARFMVSLAALTAPGAHGLERVEFRFAANPGEAEGPLSAVASGGELSRVMLALHTVAGSERPILAFDEVDAGVGGRTGRAVGRLLHRLSKGRQVLVVTHLAQIAAFADHHVLVDKVSEAGRTRARVRAVTGEARVAELARMLAGDDGPVARRHAEALLASPD